MQVLKKGIATINHIQYMSLCYIKWCEATTLCIHTFVMYIHVYTKHIRYVLYVGMYKLHWSQVCEWSEARAVWSPKTILLSFPTILLAGTTSDIQDERCE